MAFGDFGFWTGMIGLVTALLKLRECITQNQKKSPFLM
jgi:hypothetical protein